ncbi:hypothetical protein H072_2829 [Dactylellina haptotyla CBS 200.50]|uniref:DNA-directed RNA polymerase subunit n=1 Tax=Dactylellina haptotyla (strain CBS 200.50) TaxID=1284197 RepID=S8AJT4_DACHA|nr:hypothetical protein H072_2829 [Dactylellina haptotyla CBS 200.50]
MAEVAPVRSEQPHKKHKIQDVGLSSKIERTKKKRRIEGPVTKQTAASTTAFPSPPMTDPSPPSTSKSTRQPGNRTLKAAAVSSPYALTTASRYLSISPAYSATPHVGIQRDHLDPLVFKYDSTLDGVVLLHQNLRFQSPAARILGESPFAFVWCLVEFMLWKPVVGMVLEGWVNNVSPSHVGMLYANVFSVAVTSAGIPEGWKFVPAKENEQNSEAEADSGEGDAARRKGKGDKKDGTELIEGLTQAMGRWVNLEGKDVEGIQKFLVTGVKTEGGMLSLEGSFKDGDFPEIAEGGELQQATVARKQVTQLHGMDSDDEGSRRRRKERKERKKRKREGNAE